MSNKQALIEHLSSKGKDISWEELAKKYNLPHGEAARNTWLQFRKKNHIIQPQKEQILLDKANELLAKSNVEEIINKPQVTSYQEDLKTGQAEMSVSSDQEIKSLDDLVSKTNIDLSIWNITKWIQNFWANKYQVKVWLEPKSKDKVGEFQNQFLSFLEKYEPSRSLVAVAYNPVLDDSTKPDSLLIINKQDAHLNKYDTDGDNDITDRFKSFESAVDKVVKKASLSNNLSAIAYVIGSDQFNSEFTGTTTKGTPQQNILDYHKSFQAICDHEVSMIQMLAANTEELHVVFLGGNHDEYVGWHMAKWLEAYFRKEDNIVIDASEEYTKYIQFSKSALMFNHGDVIKPEKLASIFPIGAKDMWSSCENHYIFTGDKHHTLAKDFGGIEFYQIPQLSNAKSRWDKRQGHCAKVELTAFVITSEDGMSDIIKQPVR